MNRKLGFSEAALHYRRELQHILGHTKYAELKRGSGSDEEAAAEASTRIAQWILDVKGPRALVHLLEAARTIMDNWDPEDGLIPGHALRLNQKASTAFLKMLVDDWCTEEMSRAARDFRKWFDKKTSKRNNANDDSR